MGDRLYPYNLDDTPFLVELAGAAQLLADRLLISRLTTAVGDLPQIPDEDTTILWKKGLGCECVSNYMCLYQYWC
jgi:hypothetical protein